MKIIISGISGDLGSVLANELVRKNGDDVSIIGTMRRKLRANERFPGNVHLIDGCDLTNPENCAVVSDAARRLFDGPFGFIHCVGDFKDHEPFLAVSAESAIKVFESNVTTLLNMTKALIPLMIESGGGSSIAFSCNSVMHNYPCMSPFTAAKAAIDSLMRSLANEFSGDQLRFNSIVLSSLKTGKERISKPHGDFENFIPVEDMLPIIEFLLSPGAYLVNGNAIGVFKHSDTYFNTGYFQRVAK